MPAPLYTLGRWLEVFLCIDRVVVYPCFKEDNCNFCYAGRLAGNTEPYLLRLWMVFCGENTSVLEACLLLMDFSEPKSS